MKCPRCGSEFSGDICPNCNVKVIVSNNVNEVPIDNNVQVVNAQVENINTVAIPSETNETVTSVPTTNNIGVVNNIPDSSENVSIPSEPVSSSIKKDMSKIYYIILAIVFIIFVVLMGIILFKNFKKDKKTVINITSKTTSPVVETVLTKNRGVYTNLASPIEIGNITFAGLYDKVNNKTVDADVEILRHLSENEINTLVSSSGQVLNPGFRWDGVEYKVTLNDFDYLNGESIDPSMKTYLFDTYYKNNFFLVDENYYTISPISGGGTMIRNGESANLVVAYQVPIDQNYYICFGENFSSLGCFINS